MYLFLPNINYKLSIPSLNPSPNRMRAPRYSLTCPSPNRMPARTDSTSQRRSVMTRSMTTNRSLSEKQKAKESYSDMDDDDDAR